MTDDAKVQLDKAEHERLVAAADRVHELEAALAKATRADADTPSAGKTYTEKDMVEVTDGTATAHPPVPKAWLGTPLGAGLKAKRS